MPSILSTIKTLEELPDEVLLLIFRYLSSIDILSTFYGLNTRLSKTIDGYCQYVFLGQISYKRLTYVCSSILPKIGLNITSLIISDEWQGLLSKVFLEYFAQQISSTFPRMKRLILVGFNIVSLKLFLNCLEDLPELNELDIRLLEGDSVSMPESWALLHQIFTVNNNQISSVLFDEESISFSLEETDNNSFFPNIEKLTIKLRLLDDCHSLFRILPKIHTLDVIIDAVTSEFPDESQMLPASELKDFRLRSLYCSWNLDHLKSLLNRLPNLQDLSIKITSLDDSRLIGGDEFFSQLSSLSLKMLNYFLIFYDVFDRTTTLATWQQHRQELICIESDDTNGSILYTLPFLASQLKLLYSMLSIVVNSDSIKTWGVNIKLLSLFNVPSHIAETYTILTKCHRIKNLTISIDAFTKSNAAQEMDLCRLPCLTSLELLGTSSIESKDFQKLLEAAPNLYNMTIAFEILQSLFDNDPVCRLLAQRITHLKIISYSKTIPLNDIPPARLTSTFPHLRHFCLDGAFEEPQILEPFIVETLTHLSECNSLVSLNILHAKLEAETCAKGIHKWVLDHISVQYGEPFLTDYSNFTFRLWL